MDESSAQKKINHESLSWMVSVVIPIHRPRLGDLVDCLKSVEDQTYENVEIVCVDDATKDERVSDFLRSHKWYGTQLTVLTNDQREGIASSTQRGMDVARGDFVIFLDQDDMLASSAVEKLLGRSRGADVVYADETLISADGFIGQVLVKPAFSPALLEQCNYINHPVMVRRLALNSVGALDSSLDGAQDHDLLLRLLDQGARFSHVAESLYFWRASPDSVASNSKNKSWAFEASKKAIHNHLVRSGKRLEVQETERDGRFVLLSQTRNSRRVSVIIPTGGFMGAVRRRRRRYLEVCLHSLAKTEHVILDIIVVYDTRVDTGWIQSCPQVGGATMKFLPFDGEFNFSEKINLGRREANGDLVLILNDDTELIEPDSLEAMISRLAEPDVGAVGAKLLYPDGTVQHGGQVLAPGPHHAFVGLPGSSSGPGELMPLALEREVSGVTAAALMCRASVFDEVGGFESELPNNYNDVDFCLKIRQAGYRIIWSPHAVWYHFEGKSRDARVTAKEFDEMVRRWPDAFKVDMYLYPNPSCWGLGNQVVYPRAVALLARAVGRVVGRGPFGIAVRRLARKALRP